MSKSEDLPQEGSQGCLSGLRPQGGYPLGRVQGSRAEAEDSLLGHPVSRAARCPWRRPQPGPQTPQRSDHWDGPTVQRGRPGAQGTRHPVLGSGSTATKRHTKFGFPGAYTNKAKKLHVIAV